MQKQKKMRVTVLDFETSDVAFGKKKRDPSPFLKENFLVSAGVKHCDNPMQYLWFQHQDINDDGNSFRELQAILNKTDLLVAFNAKFELQWLYESGFRYSGRVFDPMVVEYILARGQKVPLNLDACCERRGTIRKLGETVDKYWALGLGFEKMPRDIVQRYGIRDVECALALYEEHLRLLKLPENSSLQAIVDMSNEFIFSLVEMERNGLYIDEDALAGVKAEFTKEHQLLGKELQDLANSVMGDTRINLSSPEQLSQLIYSRKVTSKDAWKKCFRIGVDARGKRLRPPRLSGAEFVAAVREHSQPIMRTSARHCVSCDGRGFLHKITKIGEPYKHAPKCPDCEGRGFLLENSGIVAGFKLSPTGPIDTAAGGFTTDKETIERLAKRCSSDDGSSRSKLQEHAYWFLSRLSRYSAVGTYLETFVNGIERNRLANGLLHTKLNQCITATGRLSSSDPNFQNMPRAGTFPVRRTIRSRFKGGTILEIDFKQLEFRTYVFLAQDIQGMKDIEDKIDVHAYTASIIECSRQAAKPHTFKPLYYGSSGTEAEQRYYKAFKVKYPEITAYQEANIRTVLETGLLTIPSGRQYQFLGTKRTPSGYVTNSTQISNYPCQGLATADIVPVYILLCSRALSLANLKSLIILTVHDSVVFDVYPGEENEIINLCNGCLSDLPSELERRFGFKLNVPINEGEIKMGPNWLELKEAA